jgi:hypothetical protein
MQLVPELLNLLRSSMATSSWATYHRALVLLDTFLQPFGDMARLPLPPILVALYVTHLHTAHYAASTITTHLSVLTFLHKLHGHPCPTNHLLVKKALEGAKKAHPQQDARLPITQSILHSLVQALPLCCTLTAKNIMFRSMFLLAFYGFLRVGELTATTPTTAAHILRLDNIMWVPDGSLKITFTSFKHSGGQHRTLTIGPQTQAMCPIQALRAYLVHRGLTPGFLYQQPDGAPIPRSAFTAVLNTCIKFCNLNPAHYKGHSFRIGAASHHMTLGYSDAQLRALGRWKSTAFLRYLRL